MARNNVLLVLMSVRTERHENLSKQHEELKRCISEKNTDIASIASAVHDIEKRRNNINTTQQGLLDTLNAFMSKLARIAVQSDVPISIILFPFEKIL